ncbi:MAG: 3-dehydroquinate synthase [Rhodobacteraceae bacterium]|nr:3-dehydroquinate synthase [Paracoccaceae bacterium]
MSRRSTRTIHVDLGSRSYDILIGQGLLDDIGNLVKPFTGRPRAVIVSEANVAPLYLDRVAASLRSSNLSTDTLVLPMKGEALKSWAGIRCITEWMLQVGIERNDLMIALGGGCLGDVAGFAAAVHRRGIGYVHVPTTLLAQIDSAVGGKTGINVKEGKNLVGAFHQPRLVVSDIAVLGTLPDRELRSGLGEVVKYGLIGDSQYFDWMERNASRISVENVECMHHLVSESCQIKTQLVVSDETERGRRSLLNLGHTFGHALECAYEYHPRLSHGESIAIGCMLALNLSVRLKLCDVQLLDRLERLLKSLGMKSRIGQIDMAMPSYERIWECMKQDKKVESEVIRFVLVRDIGDAFVSASVDPEDVRKVVERSMNGR